MFPSLRKSQAASAEVNVLNDLWRNGAREAVGSSLSVSKIAVSVVKASLKAMMLLCIPILGRRVK